MQEKTGSLGSPSEPKPGSFLTSFFTGLIMGLMQKECAKTFLQNLGTSN